MKFQITSCHQFSCQNLNKAADEQQRIRKVPPKRSRQGCSGKSVWTVNADRTDRLLLHCDRERTNTIRAARRQQIYIKVLCKQLCSIAATSNKRLCRQTHDFHLQCRKINPWDISVTVQRQQSSGLHKLTSRCPTMQKRSGSFRPQVEFTLSLCARPISRSPVAGQQLPSVHTSANSGNSCCSCCCSWGHTGPQRAAAGKRGEDGRGELKFILFYFILRNHHKFQKTTLKAACDPHNTEERSFLDENHVESLCQTLPAAASTSPILLPELTQ